MMWSFFLAVNPWIGFSHQNRKGTQLKISGHGFSNLWLAVSTEILAVFVKTLRKTKEEQKAIGM